MLDLREIQGPKVFESMIRKSDQASLTIKELAMGLKNQLLTCYGHNGVLENHITQKIFFEDFQSRKFDLTKAQFWQFKEIIESYESSELLKGYLSILKKYLDFNAEINALKCTFRLQLHPWYFPYHFDASENLFFNLYGKRMIRIIPQELGQQHKPSIRGFDQEIDPNLEQTFILNPGDAIFIPAGYFHEFSSIESDLIVGVSNSFKFSSQNYSDLENKFKKTYHIQTNIVENKSDPVNIM